VDQRVSSAFSRKSIECPKKTQIEPLFVGVLEEPLESRPISGTSGFLIYVFPGDLPTLLAAELPQLQKLVFGVLPFVLRAHSGIQGDSHTLYSKVLHYIMSINVIGLGQFSRAKGSPLFNNRRAFFRLAFWDNSAVRVPTAATLVNGVQWR
jgi:hypothetical protein